MSQQENEEWVRRALASARSEEPVPDDVAARLDQRLLALGAERGRPATPTRRWPRYLLGAAAAVAVVAVGVPVVQHLGSGPEVSASSASRPASASPSPTAPPSASSAAGGDARLGLTSDTPQLRTTGFGSQVSADLPQLLEAAQAYALGGGEVASACRATPAAGTRGALVQLDGRQALVEISSPRDGVRTVRALSCSDAAPLASARVAAR